MLYLKRDEGHDKHTIEKVIDKVISDTITLRYTTFNTGKGTWEVVRAEWIQNGEIVVKIDHGYSHYPSSYFKRDGKDYIITPTQSYQEGVIICLDDQKVYKVSHDGWCPTQFYLNADNTKVAIPGCFWGGSYDYRFYDISNLEEVKLIKETEMVRDSENERWEGNEFVYEYMLYIGRDGKDDDQEPWKSCEVVKEGDGWNVINIPNSSFNEGGDYSDAFRANFQDTFRIIV